MVDWLIDVLKVAVGALLAFSPLLCPSVRDFVAKKIQLSFDKALENKKAVNDRKNYISKARFDKEFEIYQNLSEKQISLVYDCGEAVVLMRGGYGDVAACESFFESFSNHLNEADIFLKRYAPFIAQAIFDKYRTLDRMANKLLKLAFVRFELRNKGNAFKFGDDMYTLETSQKDIEAMQREISAFSDSIIEYVREYLNSLDVLER